MSDWEKIIWTGLVSAIVSIIVTLLSSHFNSKAKLKELRLSSYHKERIDTVKILYGLVVELSDANFTLFNIDEKTLNHFSYKLALSEWLSAFDSLRTHYTRNRIMLSEDSEITKSIRQSLNQLVPLKKSIFNEYNKLDESEHYFSGRFDKLYGDEEAENKSVLSFFNQLKSNYPLRSVNSFFESTISITEAYFRTLIL